MRGSGGMLPQDNFEFRSSQIASDEIWDKIIVIEIPAPPMYETLMISGT